MASSYISNVLQINFDSVLGIHDNDGMVNMFRALEATGIRGFLGCPSVLYEQELEQFFDTVLIQDGNVTCEMVDRTTRRAKGFAAQICVLLKGDPAVTLGEVKTFTPLKILSEKTINTYVATNKAIDARGEKYEPDVATVAFVKKKSVSKKRPAAVSEAPVVKKKRTSSGKAVSKEKDLAIVSIPLDAEPIQTVDRTSAIPAAHPPAPKRRAPKRKLRMIAGSDDVDKIIDTVITETTLMETDMEEPSLTRSDDIAFEVTERSSAVNDEDDNLDEAEMKSLGKWHLLLQRNSFLKSL
ncbi:hypothetical protein F511_09267 [Dorcoceras hygrometricum]|uniref:Uncharacterized protein n=1 Tax=Dorcoceras hygrometricum TaxID=472368 RepID=A0A2Z7BMB5_9LAMI|nr:hypothetical protein F511_09267 [Dorcoceras hygrometricum]